MRVVVDTPVWSEFFRRARPLQRIHDELKPLLQEGSAILIGLVRQEILSGIKDAKNFERLRLSLRDYPSESTDMYDHERAAEMYNRCSSEGIQGSNTDFLICSVAVRLNAPVFTLDADFERFAQVLPIRLFAGGTR